MPGVGIGPVSHTSTPAATKPASSADSNMYPDTRVSLPMITLPPAGASTRAAALASRRVKSTVIGTSPTLPRTPAVPKYFLAVAVDPCVRYSLRAGRALPGGPCNPDGIAGRPHIMGAHDTRSMQGCNGSQRQAAREAVLDGPPDQPCQHGLARQAHQHRV